MSSSSRKLQVRKVTSNYERKFTSSSLDSTKMMKYLHIGGWKFQEVKVQSNASLVVKSTLSSPDIIDRSVRLTEGESYDIIDDKPQKDSNKKSSKSRERTKTATGPDLLIPHLDLEDYKKRRGTID